MVNPIIASKTYFYGTVIITYIIYEYTILLIDVGSQFNLNKIQILFRFISFRF